MNKNKQIVLLLALFCSFSSLLNMEQVVSHELSADSIKVIIQKCDDLQSIGRIGQTCKTWNYCYRDLMVCKTPQSDTCSSFGCSVIKNNFDACTDVLAFYAKRY